MGLGFKTLLTAALVVAAMASTPESIKAPAAKKLAGNNGMGPRAPMKRETASVSVDSEGVLSASAGGRSLQAGVNLWNFVLPMSIHWTPDKQFVYVAEKEGKVWKFNGFQGDKFTNGQVVIDLGAVVWNHGDHGLTSIWCDVRGGWLYTTWQMMDPLNPDEYNNCDDDVGCASYGMFSRWPINADGTVGEQQVILNGFDDVTADGQTTKLMCGQFSTHSMTSIAQDPNTFMVYFAGGDGASFAETDFGNLADLCKDRDGYRGAFRAQDPVRFAGKVGQYNPFTNTWRIYSTGHRNTWRLTWDVAGSRLLESETGWFTAEEINVIEDGKNYGWPCMEGPVLSPHYNDPDNQGRPFHGMYRCADLVNNNQITMPAFYYLHPEPPPPGNVMSISGVAAQGDFILWADYTMRTIDQLTNFQNDVTIARNVGACELRIMDDGSVIYVDHDYGTVQTLNLNAPIATPSSTPAPPWAAVVPNQGGWAAGAGGQISFTGSTNIIGREGVQWQWRIEYSACPDDPTQCTITTLLDRVDAQTVVVQVPAVKGTITVQLAAGTYSGAVVAAAPVVQTSADTAPCTCALPSATPSVTARPTSSFGAGGPGDKIDGQSGFTIGKLSPAATGGVIAGAVVGALGIALIVAYFAGLPQKMGLFSTAGAATAKPAAGAAAANGGTGLKGGAVAGAGGMVATTGAPAATNGKSLAERRTGAAVPSLGSAAPAGANAAGVPETPAVAGKTPGNRRV